MAIKKYIVVLFCAAIFIMSSCAIHDSFPFICFRSGCVHQQWNMRGLKKRIKANSSVRKRKRSGNNKPDNKKDNRPAAQKAAPSGDRGLSHFYTRIRFVFYANGDTLPGSTVDTLVTGMQDGKRITGVDDEEATAFIANKNKKDIRTVTVMLWDQDPDQTYRNTHKRRLKYIRHYLSAHGIAGSKIIIAENDITKKATN